MKKETTSLLWFYGRLAVAAWLGYWLGRILVEM